MIGNPSFRVDRRTFMKQATGASLFVVTREGGREEFDPGKSGPVYTEPPALGPQKDGAEIVRVQGAPQANSIGPEDNDANHLLNWLNAMRDRKQPNANVDHGFSHSLACIMVAQSYWSGKKQYWNPKSEQIVDQPV